MILTKRVEEIFKRLNRLNPNPKGELFYTNPYTLLVAVTLSAQATDKSVNAVTQNLFKTIQTPKDMLQMGEDSLRESIRTIGLYKTKAKHLILMAKQLLDEFGGEVPPNREALETLPGVGRKTANVVLNAAFGQAVIAVDTHIFRVGNRLGIAPGKTPLAVELALEKVIPKEYLKDAHLWLVLHGRYTCLARKPKCLECVLMDICPSSALLSNPGI